MLSASYFQQFGITNEAAPVVLLVINFVLEDFLGEFLDAFTAKDMFA